MEVKKEKSSRLQMDFRSCKLCPYRTKSMFLLIGHLRLHRLRTSEDSFSCHSNPPQNYKCSKCSFEADLKTTLQHHIDAAHKITPKSEEVLKTYKCQSCGFETCSLLVFSRHFYSAANDATCGLFACSECAYTTTNKSFFSAHLIVKHFRVPRSEWYECEQCLSFGTKKRLTFVAHTANEHADPEDNARKRCPYCPFQTYMKDCLNNHILDDHPDPERVNRFKCYQCSSVFKRENVLRNHVATVHGYKSLKCPHCRYRCVYNCHLKMHILNKHTKPEDVKWFECERCSFKAKCSSNLRKHVKGKHNPEKTDWYLCQHCSFKVPFKWRLRDHVNARHSKPRGEVVGVREVRKSKKSFQSHKFKCGVDV